MNHLNKVKSKLEQTLDELEDTLEREKKARADLDKNKRKVESDLKLAQEAVADLEKGKKDLESALSKKEKEISSLNTKLEEEQAQLARTQKQIKESQVSPRIILFPGVLSPLAADRRARPPCQSMVSQLVIAVTMLFRVTAKIRPSHRLMERMCVCASCHRRCLPLPRAPTTEKGQQSFQSREGKPQIRVLSLLPVAWAVSFSPTAKSDPLSL